MNASAEALAAAVPMTRIVSRPTSRCGPPREVGRWLAPEWELAAGTDGLTVLAPDDHTAQMRYAWLPSAAAVADPARRPRSTGSSASSPAPDTAAALTAAGLRDAADRGAARVPNGLPP